MQPPREQVLPRTKRPRIMVIVVVEVYRHLLSTQIVIQRTVSVEAPEHVQCPHTLDRQVPLLERLVYWRKAKGVFPATHPAWVKEVVGAFHGIEVCRRVASIFCGNQCATKRSVWYTVSYHKNQES